MKEAVKKIIPAQLKDFARPLVTSYRKRRYQGSAFACPLCGSNLTTFLPLPSSFRGGAEVRSVPYSVTDFETLNVEDYACPVCASTDRARLFALYLADELAELTEDADSRTLFIHFAPDSAQLKNLVESFPTVTYRSADLFMPEVDDKVDVTDMKPYADHSVDFFLCSHVLEHVPDDKKALREFYRILKPGGKGILMVPILLGLVTTYEDWTLTTPEQREKHFGQNDHVRIYAKDDYVNRLVAAGFEVRQYGANHFGAEVFRKHGVSEQSVLYVVMKPSEHES